MRQRTTTVLGGVILILAASTAFAGKPVPPPPPGDITGVAAGPGLEGGGASGDVTLSLKSCDAGQVLVWDGVSAWQCMTGGDVTGVTAGSGLTGGGNSGPLTVAVKTCSDGQILKSSGTDWACETPSVTGQLFALPLSGHVYFIHSKFARLRNDDSDGVYRRWNGNINVSLYATGAGPAAGAAANVHECIEAGWIYEWAASDSTIRRCVSQVVTVSALSDHEWLEWPPAADALGSPWGMD